MLQLIATSAPAEASASAIARPMPRELPVTNAFLPSRLKLGSSAAVRAVAGSGVGIAWPWSDASPMRSVPTGTCGRFRLDVRTGFMRIPLTLAEAGCASGDSLLLDGFEPRLDRLSRCRIACSTLLSRSNRPVMSLGQRHPDLPGGVLDDLVLQSPSGRSSS